MSRVLLVEPAKAVAEAVGAGLRAEDGIDSVEIVQAVADAVARMVHLTFDVVVVPAGLARPLFSASHQSERWEPPPYLVVLADTDDTRRAADLLRGGVSGWVSRTATIGTLASAIERVCAGETVIPGDVLTEVIGSLSRGRAGGARREEVLARLTPREQEILELLQHGLGRAEIAAMLHVSPNTVRTHVQSILSRLGVHSILAAVALVRDDGYCPTPSSGGGASASPQPPGFRMRVPRRTADAAGTPFRPVRRP